MLTGKKTDSSHNVILFKKLRLSIIQNWIYLRALWRLLLVKYWVEKKIRNISSRFFKVDIISSWTLFWGQRCKVIVTHSNMLNSSNHRLKKKRLLEMHLMEMHWSLRGLNIFKLVLLVLALCRRHSFSSFILLFFCLWSINPVHRITRYLPAVSPRGKTEIQLWKQ